jgi:hypothetical protein
MLEGGSDALYLEKRIRRLSMEMMLLIRKLRGSYEAG